jgi:hypothetical protein
MITALAAPASIIRSEYALASRCLISTMKYDSGLDPPAAHSLMGRDGPCMTQVNRTS